MERGRYCLNNDIIERRLTVSKQAYDIIDHRPGGLPWLVVRLTGNLA